jgi:transcriptional regulator, CdaR family
MVTITVRDVVRLALPEGTTIVAGAAGLGRQVSWIATLRATLPAFAELRGGELALLSVEAAIALDPRLTLVVLVRRLAQHRYQLPVSPFWALLLPKISKQPKMRVCRC